MTIDNNSIAFTRTNGKISKLNKHLFRQVHKPQFQTSI